MNYILLILGFIAYIVVMIDMLKTTVTVKGGGILTDRLGRILWKLWLWWSNHDGRSNRLTHAGYSILLMIVTVWIMLLLLSLSLFLMSDIDSIINSSTRLAVSAIGKIYYAGYTISTLGLGDYIASSNTWRIVSIVFAFTGLTIITMSITYLIPVLGAVLKQRKLGINIASLGSDPHTMMHNILKWDSLTCKLMLVSVSDELVEHAQNHRAYPIIHYFHNNDSDHNIILQLSRLNEALYLLFQSHPEGKMEQVTGWKILEDSLTNYIKVLKEVGDVQEHSDEISDMKNRNNFVKPTSDKDYGGRKQVFQQLVKNDGWQWNELFSNTDIYK